MSKITFDQYWDAGKGILKFFNLLDRNNRLSISNVAVIVCVVKVAVAPQVSIVDAGALLVTLLNYSHKRSEANKAAKDEQALEQANTAQKGVDELKVEIESLKELHDTISKQADDTRKALNNANITAAFGVRK